MTKKKKEKDVLKTNADKCPKIILTGAIRNEGSFWEMDIGKEDGKATVKVGMGGVCLNYNLGNKVYGWAGSHIEPGASIAGYSLIEEDVGLIDFMLMRHACIGNAITVIDIESPVKGRAGIVIGKHGGINHLIVYFGEDDLKKLYPGTVVKIVTYGMGMSLSEYPSIRVVSVDPDVLKKLHFRRVNSFLKIGVKKIIPSDVSLGSGKGAVDIVGDYDLCASKEQIEKYSLEDLRIGDLVGLEGESCCYGMGDRGNNFMTIGVLIHSDCIEAGHGPGVLPLLSCKDGKLGAFKDKNANLINYLFSNPKEAWKTVSE